MAAYFKEKGITLCFIEFMDVGNDNDWSLERVVTKRDIYDRLTRVYELEALEPHYFGEVAQRYRYKDGEAEIGFITSVSESFCSTCTRARLSSEGKFYTCLFASQGFDLRELLREARLRKSCSPQFGASGSSGATVIQMNERSSGPCSARKSICPILAVKRNAMRRRGLGV